MLNTVSVIETVIYELSSTSFNVERNMKHDKLDFLVGVRYSFMSYNRDELITAGLLVDTGQMLHK